MNSSLEVTGRTESLSARNGLDYETREWSSENVFHIYPKTFNEERPKGEVHHGVGSIRGITEKLDWVKDTGFTAIWLGPIYKSPGEDGNYDVADYRQIDHDLGTMQDVEELISAAHERNIRIIFDLVPNHTSDQSEWFAASSDPDHPEHAAYRDYYIWHDPVPCKPGEPELPANIVAEDRLDGLPEGYTVPNNWSSIFSLPQIEKVRSRHGGTIPEGTPIPAVTAWVWHPGRRQFYLAEFMKSQPSLNWQNEKVREEIKEVERFWFRKGVDGFRVDVINHIGKDPNLSDEEPAPIGTAIGEYDPGTTNPHDQWRQEKLVSYWPELKAHASDILSVLDEEEFKHRNIRLVFEDWIAALSDDDKLNNLDPARANVFNFEMLLHTNRAGWAAENIERLIRKYYTRMDTLKGAVPNQVSGNHDTATLRSRLESAPAARAAYLILAALPGALYTYQADVGGNPDMIIRPASRQRDKDVGQRDPERVPIHWNSTRQGGFSDAPYEDLWLPTADAHVYQDDNLAQQARNPRSPYNLVRAILHKRNHDPALRSGGIRMLHTDHRGVLAFARPDPTDKRRQVISVSNFLTSHERVSITDTLQTLGTATITASVGRISTGSTIDFTRPLMLPPNESLIIDSHP